MLDVRDAEESGPKVSKVWERGAGGFQQPSLQETKGDVGEEVVVPGW
jgi:hypothetical protein